MIFYVITLLFIYYTFNLVDCQAQDKVNLANIYQGIGHILGSIIAGTLSDIFGRKIVRIISGCVLSLSLFTISTSAMVVKMIFFSRE